MDEARQLKFDVQIDTDEQWRMVYYPKNECA